MSFFDQIYARLFQNEKESGTPMVVDNLLKRSESFKNGFNEWKLSDRFETIIHDAKHAYESAKEGVGRIPQVVLHQSKNSNGFAISYDEEYDKSSFHYLFDYLADQVKQLDYRLVMSKQTLKEKGKDVERKEMHYLKPKPGFVEPIDQKFGNIQIEYIENNNKPARIKFLANSYADRKYTEAIDFETLARQVLI